MPRKILTLIIMVSAMSLLSLPFLNDHRAEALSGSQFKAGRIIDDQVFFHNSALTVSQIQNFLNSKVPDCDSNGDIMYNSTQTRKEYAASNGVSTPFICLKDFKQNTPSRPSESGLCSGLSAKSNRTAAQIINDVAKACGVSQKAILVLLQKEQSLITDDWPWPIQYRSATGYGCPDTAPCDSEYYGFFNQVYLAARQFKRYAADPTYYNHRAYANNSVRFHPNSSCGSSTVFIDNQATAGLYNYTPYQPNQAALNNLYGTGNSCSSYGNRNFWRIYNDWFGPTTGDAYEATWYNKCCHLYDVLPGETRTAWIQFRNNGAATWYDEEGVDSAPISTNPVFLTTANPTGRTSKFGTNWPGGKPARIFEAIYASNGQRITDPDRQHEVRSGEIVKFAIEFIVPQNTAPGKYREYFRPILFQTPGGTFDGPEIFLDVNVKEPSYSATWYNKCCHLYNVAKGSTQTAWMQFQNHSNVTWYDEVGVSSAPSGTKPVFLTTARPTGRDSEFGATWTGGKPARIFDTVYTKSGQRITDPDRQHEVRPGEIVKFAITYTVPSNIQSGKYREYFRPILFQTPGGTFDGPEIFLDVNIN